ncbi:MAG: esterase [Ignavibacteriaceae bacterium]|nr:esterase [Ignavibacteriaceae bacterium]
MKSKKMIKLRTTLALFVITAALFTATSFSQFRITPNDTLTSITIHPDSKVTFRVYAPKAETVFLGGSDIPNLMNVGKMSLIAEGVWEVTVGPLDAGSYRYNFNVDGISVIDPRNPQVSESNMNSWSLMYVPGADFMEMKNVPHGAVSEINYYSTALNRFRRMHIYTPAGYENNEKEYPVFYLLHGAFDCDDSWSTVGRAGIILDNLFAEGKAEPMIVVMPAGHTGPFRFGAPRDTTKPFVDEFLEDFNKVIKPYVETNYRVLTGKENTAIAGLSMGGGHTLNIAIPNLNQFGYFGVFSSGIFGISGGNTFAPNYGPNWEEHNKKFLDDKSLKENLKLVWFATGKDDFLLETSRATVKMLANHGFMVKYKETSGGHTWNVWREYLNEFAQLIFK